MKSRRWVLISILVSGSPSCYSMDTERPTHSECAALFKPFFWLPMKEQLRQFAQFDLEQQYVVYICGNQEVHPPTMYLADPFSEKGEATVPFLTKKLTETHRDASVRDIVYIFSEMQRRNTYHVATDKPLLSLLENRAAGIKDDFWREYTQKLISEDITNTSISDVVK